MRSFAQIVWLATLASSVNPLPTFTRVSSGSYGVMQIRADSDCVYANPESSLTCPRSEAERG